MKSSPELNAVLEEWDNAEECIKIAEQITGKVAIPAVMELRYAGRRIGEAFRSIDEKGDGEKHIELLADAKFDCIRAQHDSIDISVNYIASFIDEALLKSEPTALMEFQGELIEYLNKIETYQSAISTTRKNRSKRHKEYKKLELSLSKIQIEFQDFKRSYLKALGNTDLYIQTSDKINFDRKTILEDALRGRQQSTAIRKTLIFGAVIGLAISALQSLL